MIPGYIHAIGEFAEYFGKSPELMGADEVREFQLHMIQEKKLALGTVARRMGGTTLLVQGDLATARHRYRRPAAGESAQEVARCLALRGGRPTHRKLL